tara:strand:+ start:258 stop:701 length:444 start_codon:yes stop_codon:yes gene_type:complete
MIEITNEQDITFNVRVVYRGDSYGLNDKLIYQSDEPLVEFYDTRYKQPDTDCGYRGQFICRYMLTTLQDHMDKWPETTALGLMGGEPQWSVTGENVREAVKYALKGMLVVRESESEERRLRRMLKSALNKIDSLEAEIQQLKTMGGE